MASEPPILVTTRRPKVKHHFLFLSSPPLRIDFSNYCSTKVKTEILFRVAMYRMAELGIEAHKPILKGLFSVFMMSNPFKILFPLLELYHFY